MGLLDKIKNTFNKTNNQTITPTEIQVASNSKKNEPITLTRRDGSSIMISQRLDRLGNPITKPSKNKQTGEIMHIPEFVLIANELSNARTIHGSTMANICMEIDPKLLGDETYTYYIADVLLSPERIPEIIDQNEHYAGGLKLGELGQVLGCYSDEQTIEGLKAMTIEEQRRIQEERKTRDQQYIGEKRAEATNLTTNYKTSHAQRLTPDMDPGR